MANRAWAFGVGHGTRGGRLEWAMRLGAGRFCKGSF